VSCTVVDWVSAPLVPVTVIVYVCAGGVRENPPPHPVRVAIAPRNANSSSAIVIQRLRRLPGTKSRLTIANAGAASGQPKLRLAAAAVVVAV